MKNPIPSCFPSTAVSYTSKLGTVDEKIILIILWVVVVAHARVPAGGSSEKQQHLTQLSDPSLRIADKPFLVAYPLGANNTDWNKTHIWTGAPYENTTVDDVRSLLPLLFHVSKRGAPVSSGTKNWLAPPTSSLAPSLIFSH